MFFHSEIDRNRQTEKDRHKHKHKKLYFLQHSTIEILHTCMYNTDKPSYGYFYIRSVIIHLIYLHVLHCIRKMQKYQSIRKKAKLPERRPKLKLLSSMLGAAAGWWFCSWSAVAAPQTFPVESCRCEGVLVGSLSARWLLWESRRPTDAAGSVITRWCSSVNRLSDCDRHDSTSDWDWGNSLLATTFTDVSSSCIAKLWQLATLSDSVSFGLNFILFHVYYPRQQGGGYVIVLLFVCVSFCEQGYWKSNESISLEIWCYDWALPTGRAD